MNQQQLKISIEKTFEEMREILLKKGDDYANQDKLSNFKLAGKIAGLTPELNCLSMIATKVARLGVLLNTKAAPKNESIQDNVIDLANYALLLRCLIIEKNADITTYQPIKTEPSTEKTRHFLFTKEDVDFINTALLLLIQQRSKNSFVNDIPKIEAIRALINNY